jgi:hypothetical protein
VIDGLAFLLGVGELDQLPGPGQAAGVGGEDALRAEFHRVSPGGKAKQRMGPLLNSIISAKMLSSGSGSGSGIR